LHDAGQRVVEAAHDDRGQPERHLVQEDQVRVGHECAADGHGLLFTTRERRRGSLQQAPEHREHPDDLVDRPPSRTAAVSPDHEVLLDRQAREEAPAFGHQAHAAADPLVGGDAGQVEPLVADGSAPHPDLSHHRPQQRRLAGPVGADDGDGLAAADLQGQLVERLEVAVAGVERLDLQR
jgi:hypothetical protein